MKKIIKSFVQYFFAAFFLFIAVAKHHNPPPPPPQGPFAVSFPDGTLPECCPTCFPLKCGSVYAIRNIRTDTGLTVLLRESIWIEYATEPPGSAGYWQKTNNLFLFRLAKGERKLLTSLGCTQRQSPYGPYCVNYRKYEVEKACTDDQPDCNISLASNPDILPFDCFDECSKGNCVTIPQGLLAKGQNDALEELYNVITTRPSNYLFKTSPSSIFAGVKCNAGNTSFIKDTLEGINIQCDPVTEQLPSPVVLNMKDSSDEYQDLYFYTPPDIRGVFNINKGVNNIKFENENMAFLVKVYLLKRKSFKTDFIRRIYAVNGWLLFSGDFICIRIKIKD